jgi:3-oxoacyl-[acyl-carrier protein] reductase
MSQVAIVSGGSTGIGLATVRALRAAGFKVGFFSSSAPKVEAAVAAIASEPGPDSHGAVVDVTDDAAVSAFHTDVETKLGAVGALVCNAGISPKRDGKRIPLHETTREQWESTLSVNLAGAFNCARACLPSMMSQRYGRIVLVGSIAARATPKLAGAPYVASKSALSGLMRSVISEYSAYGITCNIVAPGNVVTDMVAALSTDQLAQLAARVPVGRLGKPEDIALVIEMLCRPTAGFVNGAVVDVNGGEFVAV